MVWFQLVYLFWFRSLCVAADGFMANIAHMRRKKWREQEEGDEDDDEIDGGKKCDSLAERSNWINEWNFIQMRIENGQSSF